MINQITSLGFEMNVLKKLILSLVITIFLSTITTYFLVTWLQAYTIHPMITPSFDKVEIIKLFITVFIYFFSLTTLPFILTKFLRSTKINRTNFWKTIFGLELYALIFSYLATPPDLFSTLFLLLLCQLIVIVNVVVLKQKLNKKLTNES